MRIGFDARMIDWGGIGIYSRNLLESIAKFDTENEYVIFCHEETKDLVTKAKNFKKRIVTQPVFSVFQQISWANEIKKSRIDIFHSPHFVLPPYVFCPAVVTIHDLIPLVIPDVVPSIIKRWFYRAGNKSSLKRAFAVIAVSEATKNDIIRFFGVPADKIAVIPEAASADFHLIDDKAFIEAALQKYGLSKPFILSVGNSKLHKNWTNLIKAFSLLAKKMPKYKLVLITPLDRGLNRLKTFADGLGLSNRVLFINYVEKDFLSAIYNAAEMFIFPSLYEGFGLPLLESMACGTPVVTSNTSSLPEVAGDAGILIDPHDINGIAGSMFKVASDNKLKIALMEKGFERISKFSWDTTAKQTLQMYAKLENR